MNDAIPHLGISQRCGQRIIVELWVPCKASFAFGDSEVDVNYLQLCWLHRLIATITLCPDAQETLFLAKEEKGWDE